MCKTNTYTLKTKNKQTNKLNWWLSKCSSLWCNKAKQFSLPKTELHWATQNELILLSLNQANIPKVNYMFIEKVFSETHLKPQTTIKMLGSRSEHNGQPKQTLQILGMSNSWINTLWLNQLEGINPFGFSEAQNSMLAQRCISF